MRWAPLPRRTSVWPPQDRGLSFKIDDRTGKVVVSVHNNAGQVLFTVPASKALDVASGGSLDQ